jgi:hypothetical protein
MVTPAAHPTGRAENSYAGGDGGRGIWEQNATRGGGGREGGEGREGGGGPVLIGGDPLSSLSSLSRSGGSRAKRQCSYRLVRSSCSVSVSLSLLTGLTRKPRGPAAGRRPAARASEAFAKGPTRARTFLFRRPVGLTAPPTRRHVVLRGRGAGPPVWAAAGHPWRHVGGRAIRAGAGLATTTAAPSISLFSPKCEHFFFS